MTFPARPHGPDKAGPGPARRFAGLPPVERRAALALRLMRVGPDGRWALRRELAEALDARAAERAVQAMDLLVTLMAGAARRRLRPGPLTSLSASVDEAAFGRMVAAAAAGDHAEAARELSRLLDAAPPASAVEAAETLGLIAAAAQGLRPEGLPAPGADIVD